MLSSIVEGVTARLTTKRPALGLALAAMILGASAAPAAAELRTETFRLGPIAVAGYQVKEEIEIGVAKPRGDASIVAMKADVVDRTGKQVPIARLMLHHIAFLKLGVKDRTCDSYTLSDDFTKIPALAERFYAAGEERHELRLPPGYGYPSGSQDMWGMVWMLMNHRKATDRAYIQWTVTYETDPGLTPVRPYWFDVANCRQDPVYDVPGDGAAGAVHARTFQYTMPESGRLIAAGGHLHGGGRKLVLSQPDCADRTLFTSEPLWANPEHPFYNVRPVLHEPGPLSMTGFNSATGIPVKAGQRIRLTANYDGAQPHMRVMGIMLAFLAPDAALEDGCAPLPADLTTLRSGEPGRALSPPFTLPLIGLDRRGRAREIERPPGRVVARGRRPTVVVRDFAFDKPNLWVAPGSRITWRFASQTLHNVTVASGPRGFSSPNLNDLRSFSKKLTTSGVYKLYCGLHPVLMQQTIIVGGLQTPKDG